eukprot:m51a1_g2330 hypothetical protein (381) ;mRNA; r:519624-524623
MPTPPHDDLREFAVPEVRRPAESEGVTGRSVLLDPQPISPLVVDAPRKGCVGGPVWGSDVYTSDSNRCSAALHAGVITSGGGEFKCFDCPGMASYIGSERNGVATSTYGVWKNSFAFSAEAAASVPKIAQGCCGPTGNENEYHCRGRANGCTGGNVWGSGVYTTDSDRCAAALHFGAIDSIGGTFVCYSHPGQQCYPSTSRNGVTTAPYGPWATSFSFVPQGKSTEGRLCECGETPRVGEYFCKGRNAGCQGGQIWGTGTYTGDSNRCSAALHSGTIGCSGGTFKIWPAAGQQSYQGSTSNGVESTEYGQYSTSFTFSMPSGECRVCGPTENPNEFYCMGKSKGCQGGAVWGSDIYTTDSNRCSAALHYGAIDENGGTFT